VSSLIVAQPADQIGAFVAAVQGEPQPWGNFSALGLVRDGYLVAGVVYNNWSGAGVCAHIGALPGRRWMTRAFLRAMFEYPFVQCNRRRITALVARKNRHARRFVENLGFKHEGCVRHALERDDWILYGMLREECRFLEQPKDRRKAA